MIIELNDIFITLETSLATIDSSLAKELSQLRVKTVLVLQQCKRFDFRDIEANGFRSFANLVLLFGQLAKQKTTPLSSIRHVTRVLITGVSLCQEMLSHDNLFDSNPEQFIELLEVFKTLSPHLDVIYGQFCSYWLCLSMRRVMNGFTTLMAIYSKPNSILTNKSQTVAHIAQNASVEFVKSFWGITENAIIRRTLPSLASFAPNTETDLLIGRQKRYSISKFDSKVLEKDFGFRRQESVRCRLLSSNILLSDKIVLHIHGGGFVSQSPDSHSVYLRDWAHRLTNTAILSVDYSLSPQNRYPEALQEIFDVYLWLISDESKLKAKEIVICGDSAGGNLAVALSLALNQIEVKQPKAILAFYAPLILQTRASPSRLMTAVDTLLPLGVLLSCLEAYANRDTYIESDDNWFQRINSRLRGDHVLPWYRKDDLKERLKTLNHVTENAFISPLLSEDFPKDVALYLIGLHFDACLDDSVQMAKQWKGPVVLDVLDQLPHGFLNFVLLSPESKRGSDLCLDRIKQSFL